jgi:pimeloyl-ACP methyl ester carboxylesterase
VNPQARVEPASFNLRTEPVGGDIRARPRVRPTTFLRTARRVLLLIHGFNVNETKAIDGFSRFESRFRHETLRSIVRVYWPGDAARFSPASYMRQPRRARETAQRIADRITADVGHRARAAKGLQPPNLEISIVAHSLGCAVALHLLERLKSLSTTALKFPLVVLMAAAVPRYAVANGGEFNILFNALPRIWLLYSRADRTLRRWFRPGQFVERPWESWFLLGGRGAIGRHGAKPQANLSSIEGTWDHGDYWPDHAIADAVEAQFTGDPPWPRPIERLKREVVSRRFSGRALEGRSL